MMQFFDRSFFSQFFSFLLKNFLAILSLTLKYDKRDGRGFVPVKHIQYAFGDIIRRYYDRYLRELLNNEVSWHGRKKSALSLPLSFYFLSVSRCFLKCIFQYM